MPKVFFAGSAPHPTGAPAPDPPSRHHHPSMVPRGCRRPGLGFWVCTHRAGKKPIMSAAACPRSAWSFFTSWLWLLRCSPMVAGAGETAASAMTGSGESNGKTFSSTGAWALSREYVRKNQCSSATSSGVDCTYKLDTRLATCLAQFFRGFTVTELGSGVGR